MRALSLTGKFYKEIYYLYRCFDKDNMLLYVGISESAYNRIQQHAKTKSWFCDVCDIKVTNFESRNEVLRAEKEAILSEHPFYNIIHNGKKKSDRVHRAQHYFYDEIHHNDNEDDDEADMIKADEERCKNIWNSTGYDLINENIYRHRKTGKIIFHQEITK